jgi:hypothetical protein
MKKLLKCFFGLLLLVVVLAVILLLSRDAIFRVIAENRIRAQTGMDAEIGTFHVGLFEPVVTIKNFKLYNPPDFGGTPFLNIPEIHIEYDRDALKHSQLHLTLVRFDLGELDIVKNEAGQTNLFTLGVALPAKGGKGKSGGSGLEEFKRRTNLDFQGIDVLNVSIGTLKYIDLKNPANDREQKIGIENLPIRNIKSQADLTGLAGVVALRGSEVLGVLASQKNSSTEFLKLLGF